jgi:hypothetical protein
MYALRVTVWSGQRAAHSHSYMVDGNLKVRLYPDADLCRRVAESLQIDLMQAGVTNVTVTAFDVTALAV